MLNLFIAVILEGFASVNKEHQGIVTSEHYAQFLRKWEHYDPGASGWIRLEDLVILVSEVDPPFEAIFKSEKKG